MTGADVAIIDYGMGNLRSVKNAFEFIGCQAAIAAEPDQLAHARRIVLPGVGAFGDGMMNLRNKGWVDALEREVREKGKPFIGLCLGMQILAESGSEHGDHAGLGWIKGRIDRLAPSDPAARVPHIGWNGVEFAARADGMYAGMTPPLDFYFVHSYALQPGQTDAENGFCDHGGRFVASIASGNVWATQYHPEKSQKSGLQVLRNFLQHCH